MMNIELLFSYNLCLFGISWFKKDEILNYNEVNIYLLFAKLSFIWGMEEDFEI